MKRTKLMAILLATFMLLSMLPFSASATADAALAALDTITVPSVICGTYDLTTEAGGYTVVWSSNPDRAITGTQVVPGGEDTEVTLYADIFYGDGDDDCVSKEFPVLIKRAGVVYFEGFDAPVGTNVVGYNDWRKQDTQRTGTNYTVVKESDTSDNTVMEIEKTAEDTYPTNYLIGVEDYNLTLNKDFKLSFEICSKDETNHIEVRGVGTWVEIGTGKVRPDKDDAMFSLQLYYDSNLIQYRCVNPVANASNSTTIAASKKLKVGVPQTFEIQADFEEQAFWLIIDGEKVTSQPLPYARRNIYGLSGDTNGTLLGQYGYDKYEKDIALQSLWFTHEQQSGVTTGTFTVDNVEVALESPDYSMDRAINIEYARVNQNNITFNPKIADKLWRIIAGKENAGKTAIVAVFNANKELIACPQVPVDENGYAVFDYTFSGAKSIKAFIWDSMDNLQPLSESFAEDVR